MKIKDIQMPPWNKMSSLCSLVMVIGTYMICVHTAVTSRSKNCRFNVTDLGCPVYDYTDWECLKYEASCPEGTEYHCLRLQSDHSRYADGCAQSKVCLKGEVPYWAPSNDGISTHVICDWCHGIEYFNPESKLSSTYSHCPYKKVKCDYYHGIECFPENENDIHKQDRLCRCDARNNYVFGNSEKLKGDVCTSNQYLTTDCIRVEPCKNGQERLLNYTCVNKCKNGFRSNTSDECRPFIEPIEKTGEPFPTAQSRNTKETTTSSTISSTKITSSPVSTIMSKVLPTLKSEVIQTTTSKVLPTLKSEVIQTTIKPNQNDSTSISTIILAVICGIQFLVLLIFIKNDIEKEHLKKRIQYLLMESNLEQDELSINNKTLKTNLDNSNKLLKDIPDKRKNIETQKKYQLEQMEIKSRGSNNKKNQLVQMKIKSKGSNKKIYQLEQMKIKSRGSNRELVATFTKLSNTLPALFDAEKKRDEFKEIVKQRNIEVKQLTSEMDRFEHESNQRNEQLIKEKEAASLQRENGTQELGDALNLKINLDNSKTQLKDIPDKCEDIQTQTKYQLEINSRGSNRELEATVTKLSKTLPALFDAEKKRDEFKEIVKQQMKKLKQLKREIDRFIYESNPQNKQLVKEKEAVSLQRENGTQELGDALEQKTTTENNIMTPNDMKERKYERYKQFQQEEIWERIRLCYDFLAQYPEMYEESDSDSNN